MNTNLRSISLPKEIRGQILVWIGIVGGALTIVYHLSSIARTHWSSFVPLAGGAHWIISNFEDTLRAFWNVIRSLLHVWISESGAQLFTITIFYMLLATGSALIAGQRGSFKKIMVPVLVTSVFFLLGPLLVYITTGPMRELDSILIAIPLVYIVILFNIVSLYLGIKGTVFKRIAYTASYYTMCDFMTNFISTGLEQNTSIFAMIFLYLFWFVPLLIAPVNALIKHITFLLIGVAIIFGFSEVSKQVERLRTAASTVEMH
jgi:hypothetical protein